MNKPHSPSPAACVELLDLFAEKRILLSVAQFDEYFDVITEVLGRANNESYRLSPADPEGA